MVKKAKIKMYVEEAVAVKRCNKIVDQAWKYLVEYINNKCGYTVAKNMIAKLGAKPTIVWKKFGFRACGRTWYNNGVGLIEMNTNFLYSKDADEFIESTTRHELAHLICLRLFKELKHNANFRTFAKILGDDGERCANYAIPDNKPHRAPRPINDYNIYCDCGEIHRVSARRLKTMQQGGYRCLTCGKNLKNAALRAIPVKD